MTVHGTAGAVALQLQRGNVSVVNCQMPNLRRNGVERPMVVTAALLMGTATAASPPDLTLSFDRSARAATVTWQAEPGQRFQVEKSADLRAWSIVAPQFPDGGAPGGQLSLVDAVGSDLLGYYRVSDAGGGTALVRRGTSREGLSSPVATAVGGGHVFVLRNNQTLHPFDVSDPDEPVAGTAFATGFFAQNAIAAEGGMVYVLGRVGFPGFPRLQVIDASDPGGLRLRGHIDFSPDEPPVDVAVRDGLAFVTVRGLEELQWFDVSDPDSLLFVDADSTDFEAVGRVSVDGDFVYVTDWRSGKVHVYDGSDPDDIHARGTSGPGQGVDVAAEGPFAYVIDESAVRGDRDQLQTLDVSDPDLPVVRGSFDFGDELETGFSPTSVAAEGNLVFVTGSESGVGAGSLHVFDVSDPAAPVLVASVSSPRGGAVAAEGRFVYVANPDEGLVVFEVVGD